METIQDDGMVRHIQKPKMEIVLAKSADFDEIMAEQARAL
jgi:hypothetical protein